MFELKQANDQQAEARRRPASFVMGAALLALAAAYSLPSLGYPFGRDQALFFYVGREWALGALPYRDVVDIKPPGIYAIAAGAYALLGSNQWGLRLLDFMVVLGSGLLAGGLVRRWVPTSAVVAPLTALATCGWYYTTFDFWDSGQVESWVGLLVLASVWFAISTRRPGLAASLAGFSIGLAFILKFPALLFAPLTLLLVLGRVPRARQRLLVFGAYAASALAVVALTLAYFAVRGGLHPLIDILIRLNAHYATHWTEANAGASIFRFWVFDSQPWGPLLLGLFCLGAIDALRRREAPVVRAHVITAILLLIAFASVAVQRKYFHYHWGIMTPFIALAGAHGLAALARWRDSVPILVVIAALVSGLLWGPSSPISGDHSFGERTLAFHRYAAGDESRFDYLSRFVGVYGYDYVVQELVGTEIAERAQGGDLLQVEGFEPAIYEVAGLRSPSAFPATHFLDDPRLAYRRDEWRRQHLEMLASRPPRFYVTHSAEPPPIAAYRAIGAYGRFTIWERTGAAAPAPPR